MTTVSDKFWSNDGSILLRSDRLLEFWPTQDQTKQEKLNAITRFGIYISILLALYQRSFRYLFITVLIFFITYIIYTTTVKDQEIQEKFTEERMYRKPTIDSPYMNPSPFDPPELKGVPAPKYYRNDPKSKKIRQEIEEAFNYNNYREVQHIKDPNIDMSRRNIMTIPCPVGYCDTTNSPIKIASRELKSCKNNRYFCGKLGDLRWKRKPLSTIKEEQD